MNQGPKIIEFDKNNEFKQNNLSDKTLKKYVLTSKFIFQSNVWPKSFMTRKAK